VIRKYNARLRAQGIGASNEAVVTFAVNEAEAAGTRAAALIHASLRILRDSRCLSRFQVVEITRKVASDPAIPTETVAPTMAEIDSAIGELNARVGGLLYEEPGAAFFYSPENGRAVDDYGITGGETADLLPIGTGILIHEVGSSVKGRVYLPFASDEMLNAGTGKLDNQRSIYAGRVWQALHQVDTETADEEPFFGIYSTKNNNFQNTVSVSVSPFFSSLASRRR